MNAKKVRDGRAETRIFVEGKRLVGEALHSGLEIDTAFLSDDFSEEGLIDELAKRTESIFVISPKLAASIEETTNGQGICLVAKRPPSGREVVENDISKADLPIVLLLDEANNPSNLGAVIRTAEAAGVAGVIATVRSVSAFSPKALRASMGSAFRLPIWEGTEFGDVVQWAGSAGLSICAAAGSGKMNYLNIDWGVPRLLILGTEAHGLSAEQLAVADEQISIPMNSEVESLNLAVAAGVILFEARRQNLMG